MEISLVLLKYIKCQFAFFASFFEFENETFKSQDKWTDSQRKNHFLYRSFKNNMMVFSLLIAFPEVKVKRPSSMLGTFYKNIFWLEARWNMKEYKNVEDKKIKKRC